MLDNYKMNQFFKNMRNILSDQPVKEETKLTKGVSDSLGDQRTNIIYLTTACNLRCEYCYEKDSRQGLPDQSNLTTDDIDNFLNEIVKREKTQTSTVVIMGGEPFLRFDLVQYIVARAIQIPDKKWGISITTNGTLFTDKVIKQFKHLLDLCKQSSRVVFSLEISYDGSGQEKRKWPDGSSSRFVVEKAIDNIVSNDIPFRISYVVQDLNYNEVVKDVITILERWKGIRRIGIGYAYRLLDDALKGEKIADSIRSNLTPYLIEIYKEYKVPICDHVCNFCNRCKKDNFVGNSYLSPTTGISYDEKSTEHPFQQF